MTQRQQPDPRGTTTITYKNASGAAVRPYGLLEVSGATTIPATGKYISVQAAYNCRLWGTNLTNFDGPYLFNGPYEVANTKLGDGYNPYTPQWVLYNDGLGTPSVGQEWGPEANSDMLSPETVGFLIMGDGRQTDFSLDPTYVGPPVYQVLAIRNPCCPVFHGILCEDLDAPADWSVPTYALAQATIRGSVYLPKFTITNYDETLSLPAGTYIQWRKIQDDWVIEWASCEPFGECVEA